MPDLDNDLDNNLPDLIPPDELINRGQSNPERTVEPDPRQAFQEAPVEQTTNRGRRNSPIYRQMETPTNSRAESVWGTPAQIPRTQGVFDLGEIVRPHIEQFQGLDQ